MNRFWLNFCGNRFSDHYDDIHFVGQIESNATNAHIIDFAILTKCDHIISSYGTFGFWATLLSPHKEVHILPNSSLDHETGERVVLEETLAIKASGFEDKFVFFDDE